MKRLLVEEAYTKESMIQATLAAEAALSAAAENTTVIREAPDKAGSRHLESQNKPMVRRWNEFRMSENLGT